MKRQKEKKRQEKIRLNRKSIQSPVFSGTSRSKL